MGKYYRLFLNCGKVKNTSFLRVSFGFIEILPQKAILKKKSFFGTKEIPITKYEGWYHIIAEAKDDHFEDIILGKRIDYDRNGVKNITLASAEELESQLDKGITCYHFYELEPEVALYYMEKIKSDPNILEKYIQEIEKIEKKENVIEEISNRKEGLRNFQSEEPKNTSAKKIKKLIKSA